MPGAQPVDLSESVELYGLLAALIVLLLALGTWWSFAWLVLGAVVGVFVATSVLQLLRRVVEVPTISDTAGATGPSTTACSRPTRPSTKPGSSSPMRSGRAPRIRS